MHDGGHKHDGRRRQRVRLRDPDPQQPPAGVVAGAQAAAVDDGLPGQELVFGDGAEALDARLRGGFFGPGGEFAQEALAGAAGAFGG